MGGKNEETSTTSLLLAMGHLNAEVQKALGADETVRVVTMAAVAGVRGTAFDVVVGADGQQLSKSPKGLWLSTVIKAVPWKLRRAVKFGPTSAGLVRYVRRKPVRIGAR